MTTIQNITGSEILDSRGFPALKVSITLSDGTQESASTATEFSPPKYGVMSIWDHDEKRFQGKGLLQAITILENIIKPRLIGMDVTAQQTLDKMLISLDTSPTKNKIGGNTLISISMAIAKAAAKSKQIPLFSYLQRIMLTKSGKIPLPIFTMIDGGKNANTVSDIHSFLIVPASFKSLEDSIQMGALVHNQIGEMLKKENVLPYVGDQGGYGPSVRTNEDILALIAEALESVSLRLGYDIYIGLDTNANTFFKDKHYKIKDKAVAMTASEMTSWYAELCEKFHILYLEDPLAEDDVDGWANAFAVLNHKTTIVGDHFTATNIFRLQMAIAKKTINGIVIKPSFNGTVSESLAIAAMAKVAGLKIVVSDRAGETNDTFLADFAVAIEADYVRFGAPVRGERVAKYNRLLEIQKELTNQVAAA